ncbi:MAG: type II toxin-antitoxin system RelE/ParE family toxin [Burkholderiales bacterium]|nr:type II toxin-antitoxin system RelE/ParE family toxin [Burkholderiales bacterium]ODU58560.1 MAG: plasmid stabilization system protein [Acetobacteraceae bacterium SCN 69-10]
MKPVRFLEEAQVEFLEQIGYYEAQHKGLGQRFREQVEAAVGLASTHPRLGSPWKLRTHRVFPREFPFAVVYRNETNEVVIFAIAHFKRRPTYWRGRG